jgi:hypothetical protein
MRLEGVGWGRLQVVNVGDTREYGIRFDSGWHGCNTLCDNQAQRKIIQIVATVSDSINHKIIYDFYYEDVFLIRLGLKLG